MKADWSELEVDDIEPDEESIALPVVALPFDTLVRGESDALELSPTSETLLLKDTSPWELGG